MDFWVLVLRLNGKGGPSLLVPSGVLISFQFHTSCALFVMNFGFRLCVHVARDRSSSLSSLWWIHRSLLSTKRLGFTSSFETKFVRSWENPVLAREFLDSSQIMEWLADSFCRYVHKVFVIVSTNFELLLTWFDPPIIKFFKERGLKNRFWARAEFFLSPVKLTLVICCIGSTGELVFRVLGIFGLSAWLHRCISSTCISSTGEASPAVPACYFARCTGV